MASNSTSASPRKKARPADSLAQPEVGSKEVKRRKAGSTTTKGDESDSKELIALFCDRLTQLMDRRPDVIKAGRGRVNDFSKHFNIHYTTATRLLSGESLPGVGLLMEIADAFDVPEGWFLGRGDVDIDDHLDKAPIKIHIFDPRNEGASGYATIPPSQVPVGFDSSKLLFCKTNSEKGEDLCVVVKQTAEPQEGKVHLIYDPLNKKTYLRRITVTLSTNELFCIALESGRSETLKIKNLVFGKTTDPKAIAVIGPVVAHLGFNFKGD